MEAGRTELQHSDNPVPDHAVLIVNAHSRKGEALCGEAKARLEAAGITLIASHAVKDPADLDGIVAGAVRDGAPMVIVGGGDGSLARLVRHVAGTECVFAVLPLGTANSFARTLGLPLDLAGAVQTIASGRRRRIDLGRIGEHYFVNAAALGLSPMIGDTVPHKLKRYLGRVGYLGWAIWCLTRFRPFRLTVEDAAGEHRTWASEVRVFNGRYHGGVELIETTDVDSGDLVIQAVTGRSLLRLAFDWYAKVVRLKSRSANTVEFRGEELGLRTRPRQKISIDGECLARTPVTVRVAQGAVEVVVPSAPSIA
ncbi:MAG TPA: diacylglycerol kinase [Sphingomonas bacterium]|jgi:YegS/Rv2252/BmrU family lipid kinase|uniref:Diacylglycerol kinase n=1 Tax=Sphingomonas bacterium TaxID=1895847 RepID=A0A3D0WED6_9SPHN|nr:diacylglycerol kinase [Sphingomonas bacterium]